MNLILIVSDTFRYDHIGANGNSWIKTPELDRLTGESVTFDRCYTASFPTTVHRTDLVTGRYTFACRGGDGLTANDISLAEVLAEAGYGTQMIYDTYHLVRMNLYRGFMGWYMHRGQEGDVPFTGFNYPIPEVVPRGKARGAGGYFKAFGYANLNAWINREWTWEEDRCCAVTARHVSKWLEENYKRDKFFLWVDFFDPHEPWNPPEYLVELYQSGYTGPPMLHPNYGHASVYSHAELKNLHAHYAAEVTLVSKWIGHILRKIEDLQLDKDTIVVFTTDHGTYLGEHDRTGKSNRSEDDQRGSWPLYDELTHIPLMIRVPGIKPGRRDALVQPPDIMPTLLELLQVPIPSRVQGESFAEVIHNPGAQWPRQYAFSSETLSAEWDDVRPTSVRDSQWALHMHGRLPRRPELYHLSRDPRQQNNVLGEHPEEAARLHAALVEFLRQVGTGEEKIDVVEDWL